MRVYETGTIFHSDLPEDQINDLIAKIEGEIEKRGGKVVEVNQWGHKKLTYPIKKQQRGYYTFFKYVAPSKAIAELEHLLRVIEHVVRFMTVTLDESVDDATLATISKVHKKPQAEVQEDEERYAREEEFEGPEGSDEAPDMEKNDAPGNGIEAKKGDE